MSKKIIYCCDACKKEVYGEKLLKSVEFPCFGYTVDVEFESMDLCLDCYKKYLAYMRQIKEKITQ